MNKNCCYDCNTPIYWNIDKGEYWEILRCKKHTCSSTQKEQHIAN